MGCTTLKVSAPLPIITINGFGFASVKGFVNKAFDTPCEEKDIIGESEAVNVFGEITNNSLLSFINYKITVEYDRPDGTHSAWIITGSELGNGTFKHFGYTDSKYIEGQYTNLQVNVVIV